MKLPRLPRVSTETVRNYIKEFVKDGIEGLETVKFRQQTSEMANHRETLREHLGENPAASLPHLANTIYHLTGLKCSPVQISKYLQREGLKRMKVGTIPAKAEVEKQTEFLENELKPRLAEAKAGNREVFF